MSDFSPFEGKKLRGWPVATIKGGKIIARDGKIVGKPNGRYLPRSPRRPALRVVRPGHRVGWAKARNAVTAQGQSRSAPSHHPPRGRCAVWHGVHRGSEGEFLVRAVCPPYAAAISLEC